MTDQYSREVVGEVLSKTRIEDVVSEYLKLRPSGRRFTGVCPFHGDKDPSFSVNPEKGLFYCFGCGAGGNVFTFLMRIENLTFNEALAVLAKRAGVQIVVDAKKSEELSIRERLMAIVKEAALFYHGQLLKPDNAGEALEYLKKRGISQETVKLYRLGYAPRGKINALYYLEKRGFTREDIVKSGMVMKRMDTAEYVDYFRNRVTIPITDMQGRFIAMGGRSLEEGGPKYLNSPETPLFSKGRNLFGLYHAKKAIQKEDQALVVEGYMDQIMLFQQGFHHSVASLGTSLTPDQAKLLRKFCTRCVLAYDADNAGKLATARGIDVFEEAGMATQVLVLPQGEDPDSFFRHHTREQFQELLSRSHDLVEYKMKTLRENLDLSTPAGKADYVKEILPVLSRIIDPVKRDEYIKKVSEETGVHEEFLRKTHVEGRKATHPQAGSLEHLIASASAEEKLLRLLLLHPRHLTTAKEGLSLSEVGDKSLRSIYEVLFSMKEKDSLSVDDFVPYLLEEGIMHKVTEFIMTGEAPPLSGEALTELIRELLQKIRDEKLRARFKALEKEVEQALSKNTISHTDERFIEYQRLYQYFKGRK
ncbi:MAG: DNA primase [Candidatus Eremiobacteraeota bacterium]|nr:DNA primase [Candidatus Eremiobacteraeota bacterium]